MRSLGAGAHVLMCAVVIMWRLGAVLCRQCAHGRALDLLAVRPQADYSIENSLRLP